MWTEPKEEITTYAVDNIRLYVTPHSSINNVLLNKSVREMWKMTINLNGAGNVETLFHARDVKLDHSEVFAFDCDTSKRPHKSETQEAYIKGGDTDRCHENRTLGVGTIDSLQNEGIAIQDFRILILFSHCNIHHDNA